jgi:hypothetical protein
MNDLGEDGLARGKKCVMAHKTGPANGMGWDMRGNGG